MTQKFYFRAENMNNPNDISEIVLDMPDVLSLIQILIKRRTNVRLGKKIVFLLRDTNRDAERYLNQAGIVVKEGI